MVNDEPGSEFTGTSRFVVERRLGAGGMGVVYQALDRERGVRVALKLLPQVAPNALARFKREFRSLASIVHPNLVELYELVADDDRWFFTMEAIEGVDFLRHVRADGLDVTRLRHVLRQLVEGVGAIHTAGRVHQDLKPSNVMVRADGSTVILDFGLVSELGSEADAAGLVGTAAYMAPEQWSNSPLAAASDWYGVGVMLYEALTGALPFAGRPADMLRAKLADEPPPPSTVRADIPPDLDSLCCDLLRRDPAHRPSGAQILARLGHARAPEAAPAYHGHSLLVGRDRHLRLLASAMEAVESGATVTAHVQGQSGSGKTALVEHFLEPRRGMDDVVVLGGRCYEQESVPYKALDSLIDALADHLGALPDADIAQYVPVQAAVLARVFPVLERVPAIAQAPTGALRITDPRELRRAAVGALREMLTRIGQRHHLVLAIDDLQWGDVDSASVIGEILQPPDPPRMLLVLAYRSEYAARSACLRTLLQQEVVAEPWQRRVDVLVEPLSAQEGEELARRLLTETTGVDADSAARIAREAGGNPYFIGELSRHVGAHVRRGADDAAGPVDLDSVLWTRVTKLPATARELLELTAVAGQPLHLGVLLSTVAARPDIPHALALLRAQHFLRGTGTQLTDVVETYHDRVRESVVQRLRPDTIRQHHARLASTLEATGTADAETVAGHYEGAGDLLKAGHYYTLAAGAAATALAFDHAATFYRQALRALAADPSVNTALQRELGRALSNAGRGFEAAEAYLAAVRTAPADEHFDLERMAAEQYCISGYVREGRVIFQRLLRRVGLRMPSNPAVVLATLLYRRARLWARGLEFTARPEAAVSPETLRRIDLLWSVAAGLSVPNAVAVASLLTEGLLEALNAGEPYRLSRLLAFEAFLRSSAGVKESGPAAALIERAGTLARQIDSPHALGVALVMSGMVAHLQCRFRDAVRLCEEGEMVLRRDCSGVWWEISLARSVIGWATFQIGDSNELRRRSTAYLAEARDRGDRFLVTNLRTVTSPWLLLLDDEPDAAARELHEAMNSWPREGFDLQHVNGMFTHANIAMYRGDGSEALQSIDSRWALLVRGLQLQTQLVRIMMTDVRARAALSAAERSPQPGALVARAERAARKLAGEGTTLAEGFSHTLLAGVASLRHQNDRAVDHLREAVRATAAADDGYRHLAAHVRLAELVHGEANTAHRSVVSSTALRDRIRNPSRFAAMLIPGFPAR